MADTKTYPRKPIELTITVNGFTWDEVLAGLDDRVARVRERHEHGVGVSASGSGCSHSASVDLRDVTQAQFIEESIAWLEAQRVEP